jgi:hypothetical protein
MNTRERAEQFLKGTFKYDEAGQMIWLIDAKGNYQHILDLRGWGRIQHLFEGKKGSIDMDAAAKFQDTVGELIVEKLNASLPVVTDEEIKEKAKKSFYLGGTKYMWKVIGFIRGARWMRDRLQPSGKTEQLKEWIMNCKLPPTYGEYLAQEKKRHIDEEKTKGE